MLHRIRYFLGAIISVPLLPFLVYQGKKIRREVPELPEATEPQGFVDGNYDKELTVIFIGESTFAGVGVNLHQNGFAGNFARKLSKETKANIQWTVYARSGYTAAKMHERLLPKIKEDHVDLIVLGTGGNDAFKLHSPKKWRRDMNNLLDALQEKYPTTPIACTNMPPIKLFPAFPASIKFVIGNLGEILGDELESMVANFDDVHYNKQRINLKSWKTILGSEPKLSELFSDGVHPSQLTYELWAEDMVSFVVGEKIIS
jgi:lysophospholipase L1-like esterase